MSRQSKAAKNKEIAQSVTREHLKGKRFGRLLNAGPNYKQISQSRRENLATAPKR